jgi:hypothetical protein
LVRRSTVLTARTMPGTIVVAVTSAAAKAKSNHFHGPVDTRRGRELLPVMVAKDLPAVKRLPTQSTRAAMTTSRIEST